MTTKPQSTTEALEPCPFCGAKPRLITIPGFEPRCYVMCSLGCGACGPEFNGRDAADRATASWNTRLSPATAAPVVDENTDSISLAAQEIVDHFAFAAAVAHNNNFMLPRQDPGRIESIIRKHIEATAAPVEQSDELTEAQNVAKAFTGQDYELPE